MNRARLALAVVAASVALSPVLASAADDCLGCHSGGKHTLDLANGESFSVDVDTRALARSPHKRFDCIDCHDAYEAKAHPKHTYADRRAVQVALSQSCEGDCHTPEGMHEKMLAGLEGTLCIDCHGAHDVVRVDGKAGCMGCHQHQLQKALGDGTTVSLLVDPEELKGSVHESLECLDCHDGYAGDAHPTREYPDARALTAAKADVCKSCHFDKYTRSLEGIHYELSLQGHLQAPTCVDCHGAHGTRAGAEEKLQSARRCQRCHEEIYETYAQSVHGAALLDGESQDVPVCADCHRAHDIADPRTADFANRSPETCGTCHADAELMARHGLSTAVLSSYLDDFHGLTASLYAKEGGGLRRIAVCTDCHGIHDIRTTHGAGAIALKEKLLERCQQCHPDAREGFPDAWLSHYEPSWERASLVWVVDLGYKIFIPFMLVGLLLQIVLHVWRYSVHR